MKVKHFTIIGLLLIIVELIVFRISYNKQILSEMQYFICTFSTTCILFALIFIMASIAASFAANEPETQSPQGGPKASLFDKTINQDVGEITMKTANQIWEEVLIFLSYFIIGYQILKKIKYYIPIFKKIISWILFIYNKFKILKDCLIYYAVIGILKIKNICINCWEYIKSSVKWLFSKINVFNYHNKKVYA